MFNFKQLLTSLGVCFIWFICYELSSIYEAEQGKVFVIIVLFVAFSYQLAVWFYSAAFLLGSAGQWIKSFLILVALFAFHAAIILFAAWCVAKLINVDFFVTYEIMIFGRCMMASQNNSN